LSEVLRLQAFVCVLRVPVNVNTTDATAGATPVCPVCPWLPFG
jgi:hypothetical protein